MSALVLATMDEEERRTGESWTSGKILMLRVLFIGLVFIWTNTEQKNDGTPK
jgi:hypothetical protein